MKMKTMLSPTISRSLEEGFKEFIRYCRVKNLAEKTIFFYEECYERLCKFYPCEQSVEEITKGKIEGFILFLKDTTNLNSISINSTLRGIRAMLYYFMRLGYIKEYKIELIKQEKKIKETYSESELKLLLEKPNIKNCSFTEYRNWVIINYLLATGNRANTLINMKVKDIDFEDGFIKLETTKNKRQQLIPMSRVLSKVLLEYLQYRKGEPEDYLFCSAYGVQLTLNALETAISKYNQKRGVMKTSIHLFRHTFAKTWILSVTLKT